MEAEEVWKAIDGVKKILAEEKWHARQEQERLEKVGDGPWTVDNGFDEEAIYDFREEIDGMWIRNDFAKISEDGLDKEPEE